MTLGRMEYWASWCRFIMANSAKNTDEDEKWTWRSAALAVITIDGYSIR